MNIYNLTSEHLNEIMNCIDTAKVEIDKNLYFPSSKVEILNILKNSAEFNSFAIGIRQNGILIAVATVEITNNLNLGFNLIEKYERLLIIQDTVVIPKFRGKKLQYQLWEHIFSLCKKNDIVICSIHPENIPSLKNAQSLDMTVINKLNLYNNSPRLILMRKIIN